MNKNLNLKLSLNPKAILAWLQKSQAYLIGVALVGIFGYTAWILNDALNTEPAATAETTRSITFDKKTIESLKALQVVSGEVAPVDLGKTDPFGN